MSKNILITIKCNCGDTFMRTIPDMVLEDFLEKYKGFKEKNGSYTVYFKDCGNCNKLWRDTFLTDYPDITTWAEELHLENLCSELGIEFVGGGE